MTPAEAQKRARDKKREQGVRHFLINLRGDQLGMLEELAEAMQVSPSRALTYLVNAGFSNVWFALQDLREAAKSGGDTESAVAGVFKAFGQEQLKEGGVAD